MKPDLETRRDAIELLESSRIVWRRDFDAVIVGWVVGVLMGMLSVVSVLLALK